MLFLMLADSAMHWRKDRLYRHAILDCIPPNDEVKVGATLVRLLRKAASSAWSFAYLAVDVLPKDGGDGIPSESPYNGGHRVSTLVLCCAG